MKKFLFIALAAVMVVGMSACGNSAGNPEVVSQASMAVTEVEDTLDGLCKYLEGNGIVTGTPVNMQADIIGATAGRKYTFEYDKNLVEVELYEFDLNNLNETAQKYITSVQQTGSFNIVEQDVKAMLSNSGKYMMIYTDRKGNEEGRLAQTQKAERLFKEFKSN
ncbi:MAG: hypothetical protein HFJ84_10790 [Clostridiales bacterium]|jgi:hypothetical protein|nr:hypothetical protein [Clostridiales bacterium]